MTDVERIARIRKELAKHESSGYGIGFAYSAIKFLLQRLDTPKSLKSLREKAKRVIVV